MQEQLFGTIEMEVSDSQFRMSTDSMVLADFCRLRTGAHVLDAGCGCGALSLLLLGAHPDIQVTGVEILPEAAGQAQANAVRNRLEDRFSVLNEDLRGFRAFLSPGSFDAVVSNPPYYPVASGFIAGTAALSSARSEITLTFSQLCESAAYVLPTGGSFFLVHKPERLTDVLCCLRQTGLEPKRLCFVKHAAEKEASLLLLEARRGGKPGLTLEPDLVLFRAGGSPTAQYLRIYHCKQEKTP